MPFRCFLSVIFLLSCSLFVQAQHSGVKDSLLNLLKTTESDSIKLAALNQLGFEADDYGLRGEQYTRDGLALSSKLNLGTEKAKVKLNQSLLWIKSGKYDSALLNIQSAYELYPGKDSIKHSSFYAKYYFCLGMLTLDQGSDKDGSLNNFLVALRLAKQSNSIYLISACYGSVTTAYNYLRLFDKSVENSTEYLNFALLSKDTLAIAKAYQNLSAAYLNAGNTERHDSYSKEFEKLIPYLNNPYYNWLLAHNQALGYAEKGLLDQANTEAQKSIDIAKDDKLPPSKLMASYYLMGYCHYLSKQYQSSNKTMEQVAALADSTDSPEYKMYAISGLAENYYQLNDIRKAYDYLSLQLKFADSISSEKIKINSNYLHIKNKIEQKENQIKQQQSDIRQNKKLTYLLAAGLISLLAIAVLGYRNYHNRKKIQEQRITELETEKQLLATQSLLKGQEEERLRIAKDLHDGLGGLLSGVKLQLGAMKGNLILTEENGIAFNRVLNNLEASISEMRRVAHNMMPETLLKFGLQQALLDYSNGLSYQQDFTIQCEFLGMEKRMDPSTELVIYRIVQELINNAVKHSEATTILVQLMRQEEDRLNITVEDNGKGFDPNEIDPRSAGLRNITSRVKYLNGKMDIQSEPGEGTAVYIECEIKPYG